MSLRLVLSLAFASMMVSGTAVLVAGAAGDPVGFWHLDEGAGSSAADASGNGLTGAITGATWAPGVSGRALKFAGGTDGLAVPRNSLLEPPQVTVDLWVRAPQPPGSWVNIIAKGSTICTASSYALNSGPAGGLRLNVSDASRVVSSPSIPPSLWDGTWHHVAGTYDGSTARIYLDGQQVGTGTSSGGLTIDYAKTLTNDLLIGYPRQSCGGAGEWVGSIDEPRIWPRALNGAEIAALVQEVRIPTAVDLALSTDRIKQGARVTLTAQVQPSSTGGTVTFKDTTGGAGGDLGTAAVSASGLATLVTDSLVPGTRRIVASFDGTSFYRPSDSEPRTIVVVADTVVSASKVGIQYATFYPIRDSFRDTLAMRGKLGETATVTIRIRNGANRIMKSWVLRDRSAGWYSASWNGRRANGSLLPAGRYRVVQTIRDRFGNVKNFRSSVVLSHQRLVWKTMRRTIQAARYSSADRKIDGWVRSSPSRWSGGAVVHGGSTFSSFGRAFYRVPLPRNVLRYGSFFFCAQGIARSGYRPPFVGLSDFSAQQIDWVQIPSAPSSCWGIRLRASSTNLSRYVRKRSIEGSIVASGFYGMSYDAGRVAVVVRYAVLGSTGPATGDPDIDLVGEEGIDMDVRIARPSKSTTRTPKLLRPARRRVITDEWSLGVIPTESDGADADPGNEADSVACAFIQMPEGDRVTGGPSDQQSGA